MMKVSSVFVLVLVCVRVCKYSYKHRTKKLGWRKKKVRTEVGVKISSKQKYYQNIGQDQRMKAIYWKQKPDYIQKGEFIKDFDKENAKLEKEVVAKAKESSENFFKKKEQQKKENEQLMSLATSLDSNCLNEKEINGDQSTNKNTGKNQLFQQNYDLIKQSRLEQKEQMQIGARRLRIDTVKKTKSIGNSRDDNDDNGDKKKLTIPAILSKEDPVDLKSLKGTLMTKEKFGTEFGDDKWEDAQYVRRISEYANRDLQYNVGKIKRPENTIKKSFIGEKKFKDEPDMYRSVKPDQFTDIVIPYKQDPQQLDLWKDYKTNYYRDVEYKGMKRPDTSNYEMVTQLNGNNVTYEKVIQGHKTNIMNKEIRLDNDDNAQILAGIQNPMQKVFIEQQINKNIVYDDKGEYKPPSNKGKLDEIVDDIGKQLKKLKDADRSV